MSAPVHDVSPSIDLSAIPNSKNRRYWSKKGVENKVDYSNFLDICNILERMQSDGDIYWHIESFVDSIHKRFRNEFNNVQQADILKKLNEFVATMFPSHDGIRHEGYKILVEAQIARLFNQNSNWKDLEARACAIPNLADKAFVLMQVAAAMPPKQKPAALQLMQNAKALIHEIPFFEDRYSRYETLARLCVDIDKKFSKDCLRQAWNETNPLSEAELPKARQRIIDFAHRLDPEFASTLASETDTDHGRDFARAQIKQGGFKDQVQHGVNEARCLTFGPSVAYRCTLGAGYGSHTSYAVDC